jgi:hypothetical protein
MYSAFEHGQTKIEFLNGTPVELSDKSWAYHVSFTLKSPSKHGMFSKTLSGYMRVSLPITGSVNYPHLLPRKTMVVDVTGDPTIIAQSPHSPMFKIKEHVSTLVALTGRPTLGGRERSGGFFNRFFGNETQTSRISRTTPTQTTNITTLMRQHSLDYYRQQDTFPSNM